MKGSETRQEGQVGDCTLSGMMEPPSWGSCGIQWKRLARATSPIAPQRGLFADNLAWTPIPAPPPSTQVTWVTRRPTLSLFSRPRPQSRADVYSECSSHCCLNSLPDRNGPSCSSLFLAANPQAHACAGGSGVEITLGHLTSSRSDCCRGKLCKQSH